MTESRTSPSQFWHIMDDPINLMQTTVLLNFNEPICFTEFTDHITSRLRLAEILRCRQAPRKKKEGPVQWEKDPHFDIRSHVQRAALPAPGNTTALQDLIEDLLATPLDPTKPPWHINLIENNRGCTLILRAHQTLVENTDLLSILFPDPAKDNRRVFRSCPTRQAPALSETNSSLNQDVFSTVEKAAAGRIRSIGKQLVKAGRSAAKVARLTFMPPATGLSANGKPGVAKAVAWSSPISHQKLDIVASSIATDRNPIVAVIAALTGAIRRHLIRNGRWVNDLNLPILVPDTICSPQANRDSRWCIAKVFLSLPVYVTETSTRCQEVNRRMKILKTPSHAASSYPIPGILKKLPPGLARLALSGLGRKSAASIVTMNGPEKPIRVCGRRAETLIGMAPRPEATGLGITLIRYADRVTLGFVSDHALMPNPGQLAVAFEEELDELYSLGKAGVIHRPPLVINDRRPGKLDKVPENVIAVEAANAPREASLGV